MDIPLSVDSVEKQIKFKICRLRLRIRRLMSRSMTHPDPRTISRITELQREARYLRISILRIRRSKRVNVEHNVQVQSQPRTSHTEYRSTNPISISNLILPHSVQNNSTTIDATIAQNSSGQISVLRSRQQNISRRWNFGIRTTICSNCKAVMWLDEKTRDSPLCRPKFSLCCKGGQVILPLLPNTPEYLDHKFCDVRFKEQIRTYNSMLSFTSMGGKIDRSVLHGRGPYVYRISGSNFHQIGSLLPQPGNIPKFAQLYIYDTDHESSNRLRAIGEHGNTPEVDLSTLEGLQMMLNSINPYVEVFRNARSMILENGSQNMHVRILHSRDGRQYIRPTANEVAALIVGDGSEDTINRDIIVRKLDGTLRRINETHPSYMPLQYPLLFPYGTDGWRTTIQFTPGSTNRRDGVSMREFYAFRLQHRDEEGKNVLQGGRLLQQFIVDSYAAIEQNRLNFIRFNQNVLRADLYKGLEDAVTAGDTDASAIGRRFILPSSFTGGPRNMAQHYQDAMAICRVMGYPDFFITFTCNPRWPEIQQELCRLPSQRTEDRPDIVSRVFRIKMKRFMKDFKKDNFFGKVIADIHVIEFQKRGLPHSHIILTLNEEDKPESPEEIDNIISAEIPDELQDPLAFETVMRCMIHGPCGAANPNSPCMVNGKCSKGYPKKFINETTIDENGFVIYRRRNTNKTYKVNGFDVDNRWIIPYNRDLIVRFDAHINVERCAHSKVIKYLYKYINKGHDRATIVIENNVIQPTNNGQRQYKVTDEVKQYLDCRYVSSIESCWRIFEFELQNQYPSVERLQYHLPGEQCVVFRDNDDISTIVNQPGVHETMFTKWFEANRTHSEANNLTYAEFPTSWVWNRTHKKWTRRQQRICIGRLAYAHPNSGERYYLRMLLNKVRGAKCYEDIRTVNGSVHPTFKSACIALGLLEDDNEWHQALQEASTWATGSQLRNMFCSMLMFSEIINPHELWENNWSDLTDDLQNRERRRQGDTDIRLGEIELRNLGLLEIEHILNRNGRSLTEYPHMPLPSSHLSEFVTNRLIREELDYDITSEGQLFQQLHAGMNADQLSAYTTITKAYTEQTGGFFFVYGSGGTGKTYLWKTLIAKFRSDSKIVISVASSGITSLLLPGGKTAHSRFKIPLNPNETSCCSITQKTDLAMLIQEASLIIWDEAPMISRYALESVDRTFRDILKNTNNCSANKVFGGKLFVLGGDFRQILPVVPKGGREQIVATSLPRSSIWNHCHVLHLRINMRVTAAHVPEDIRRRLHDFIEWIKLVGEGNIPGTCFGRDFEPNWIHIPNEFLIPNDERALSQLIDTTYPDIFNRYGDLSYLNDRAILAPKNSDVDEINYIILSKMPGEIRILNSADKLCPMDSENNDHQMYPTEFLNSLNFPGMPPHTLQLKVGASIMLLRNLNQSLGLCNGTRLVVTKIGDRVIEAKVITGPRIGDIVLISRVDLSPTSGNSPFIMKRRQFPVKLAFAMTINKSQGQTIKNVGLYLPNPVFSHGQLYVALSRVTSPSGLKILIVNKDGIPVNFTKNVVYKEVFNDIF